MDQTDADFEFGRKLLPGEDFDQIHWPLTVCSQIHLLLDMAQVLVHQAGSNVAVHVAQRLQDVAVFVVMADLRAC